MARRRRRPRKMRTWLRTTLAGLVGVSLGTIGGAVAGSLARPAPAPVAPTPVHTAAKPAAPSLSRGLTILAMGVDATGNDGRASLDGNTDTMMLLRLSPAEHEIFVFSIPRDTRVPIPGHGIFKINAACEWGGPRSAARVVSRLLHVSIDRYVLISLDGLREAIDAIGGVNVTVPKRLDYDDRTGRLHIHLRAGYQHLDGRQVEGLLRFRHDRNGTDIARVFRQQQFLAQVAPQLFSPSGAMHLPWLWRIVSRHARTDLTPQEILEIARWVPHLDPGHDFQMAMLHGDYRTIDRYCYWVARPALSATFLDRHFGATLPLPRVPVVVRRPTAPQVALGGSNNAADAPFK